MAKAILETCICLKELTHRCFQVVNYFVPLQHVNSVFICWILMDICLYLTASFSQEIRRIKPNPHNVQIFQKQTNNILKFDDIVYRTTCPTKFSVLSSVTQGDLLDKSKREKISGLLHRLIKRHGIRKCIPHVVTIIVRKYMCAEFQ